MKSSADVALEHSRNVLEGKRIENMIYELLAYNTDQRYDDVRYREYSSSEKKAKLFSQIPKIQFTDSGHGIVFCARPHEGKRKPCIMVLSGYVRENLAKFKNTKSKEKQKELVKLSVKITVVESYNNYTTFELLLNGYGFGLHILSNSEFGGLCSLLSKGKIGLPLSSVKVDGELKELNEIS